MKTTLATFLLSAICLFGQGFGNSIAFKASANKRPNSSVGGGSILTVQSATNVTIGIAAPWTWTVTTPTMTDGFLLYIYTGHSGNTPATVTHNGTLMTLWKGCTNGAHASVAWYRLAPPSGTHDFSRVFLFGSSGYETEIAVWFSGVNQSTPVTVATNFPTPYNTVQAAGMTNSFNVGELVLNIYSDYVSTVTSVPDGGQTIITNTVTASDYRNAQVTRTPGDASVASTWTWNTTFNAVNQIVGALIPAP